MMRWIAYAMVAPACSLLAAACSFDGRAGVDDAAGDDDSDGPVAPPDARIDAAPDDPCLDWTFTPAEFDPCGIPAPLTATDIELDSGVWILDGDTGILSGPAGAMVPLARATVGDLDVISVRQLDTASGTILRLTGPRPIVIAAWGDIFLDGTVEARSTVTGGPGPGARATCPLGPSLGLPSPDGDGGGGGGAYRGHGGTGGPGQLGLGLPGSGGMAQTMPAVLRGGCPGADSTTLGNGTPGTGGAGGGALMLAARDTLTIADGIVTVSGAGGTGGDLDQTGGGGGGSGGMLKLQAHAIVVTSSASLSANGGQGGGGCDNNTADPGANGRIDDARAYVNNREGGGGHGGAGGYVDVTDGVAAETGRNNGGGGGGGGVGFIVYRAVTSADLDSGATISPTAEPF